MIIYGAGGHAKVVASIINARSEIIKAIFDDDPEKKNFYGFPIIHSYQGVLFEHEPIILAIGDNMIRRRISEKVHHEFGNAIHPSSIIAPDVVLGAGTVVMHNAVIQTGSKLGAHNIVNTSSIIDHDCLIGNFVHIAPGAILCGSVKIGENTFIGAGSTIIENLTIGKNCVIGAGSVVTTNIPDYATVYGNPARIIKS